MQYHALVGCSREEQCVEIVESNLSDAIKCSAFFSEAVSKHVHVRGKVVDLVM